MRRSLVFLAIVFTSLLSGETDSKPGDVGNVSLVKADPVGTLPGEFSVDGNGSATYSVQIETPPGTAGVAPSLALTYQNQRGNGYLGVGWSLNGISAITRCGARPDLDLFTGGISFQSTDRFCLDGLRLVAVTGVNGADGTVYRLETDNYTRIVSHYVKGTACGGGPCYFTAVNKDGTSLRFGYTSGSDGSRIPATGLNGSIRVWNLDRSLDRNGNFVSVFYEQNLVNGEYYPQRIDYTGNEGGGLKPQRSVIFAYTGRNDVEVNYVGGAPVAVTQRLQTIETRVRGQTVLTYSLAYGNASGQSFLSSITLCGAKGGCLPPTTFTAESLVPGPGFSAWAASGKADSGQDSLSSCLTTLALDANGDGLTDLVCIVQQGQNSVQTWVRLMSPQGFQSWSVLGPASSLTTTSCSTILSGDANADGIDDLLCVATQGQTSSQTYVQLLVANTSQVGGWQLWGSATSSFSAQNCQILTTGDANGDGAIDLFCIYQSSQSQLQTYAQVSQGKSPGSWIAWGPAWTVPNTGTQCAQLQSGDANGDGLTDLFCITVGGAGTLQQTYVQLALQDQAGNSSGAAWYQWAGTPTPAVQSCDTVMPGDVNRDGLTELFCLIQTAQGASVFVLISTGVGSPGWQAWGSSLSTGNQCAILTTGDVNNDGYSDVVCGLYSQTGSQSYVLLSETNQAGSWQQWGSTTSTLNVSSCDFQSSGDFNGDGLTDLICYTGTPSGETAFVQFGQFNFYEIQSIGNGLGGTINISYQPISNATIFQNWPGIVTYPVRNVVDYSRVVQSYTESDGRNAAADQLFSFSYSGYFRDVSGPGILGMGARTVLELATGNQTNTNYNQLGTTGQSSPLRGTVASMTVIASNKNELMGWNYSYRNGASKLLQNKGIRQPLRTQEIYTYYQSGKAGYSLRSQYGYDEYANLNFVGSYGESAKLTPNLFTCHIYQNDPKAWALGYVIQSKNTATEKGCISFLGAAHQANSITFNAQTDLTYEKKSYDGNLNLISESDWDDANNVWLTTTYKPDSFGNRIQETSPSGVTIQYSFDPTYKTFPASITSPNICGKNPMVEGFVYEPFFGTLQTHRDVNGNLFSMEADDLGREVAFSGPDPAGKLTRIRTISRGTDATGIFVKQSFRTAWKGGSGPSEQSEYFDGRGRVFRNVRNGQTDATPIQIDTVFNNRNLIGSRTLPYFASDPSFSISYAYDAYSRPIMITDPDQTQQVISFTYAGLGAGLQLKRTIAYGTSDASTEIRYLNGRGSTVRHVAPNGFTARYSFDPLERPISIATSPAQRFTKLTYDAISRLKTRQTSDAGTEQFQYDTDGRFISETDGAGNSRKIIGFDPIDRPLGEVSTSEAGTLTINASYDSTAASNGCGELTGTTQPDAKSGPVQFTFGYDAYRNQIGRDLAIGGKKYPSAFAYDPMQRLTEVTNPDSSRQRLEYRPDDNLGAVSIASSGNSSFANIVTYASYDALDNLLSGQSSNGVGFTYEFYPLDGGASTGTSTAPNSMAKLKSISIQSNDQVLVSRTFNWNYLYAVTGIADQQNAKNSQQFVYDTLGMGFLKQAQGGFGTEKYDYDSIGNFSNKSGIKYSYQANTDLLTGGPKGLSYGYYGNGNLKQEQSANKVVSYQYDIDGNLITAQTGPSAQTGKFAYEIGGERIFEQPVGSSVNTYYISPYFEVNDFGNGNILKTHYVHGLNGPVAAITDSNSGPAAIKSPWTDRLRSLPGVTRATAWISLLGFSGLLFIRRRRAPASWHVPGAYLIPLLIGLMIATPVETAPAGLGESLKPGANGAGYPVPGMRFFHQDQVNSVVAVTDENAKIVAQLGYTPYGEFFPGGTSGTDDFRPKFGGKTWSYSLGHYQVGARFYDPRVGRFTTPDPAKQFYNPYMYAANSPVSYIDPSGEWAFLVAMIVVGAYFGAVSTEHSMNPTHWNWSSGKTWGGLLAGAVLGGTGESIAVALKDLGGLKGFAGMVALGGGENAAYTALGGGSAKETAEAGGIGMAMAGGLGGAAMKFSRDSGGAKALGDESGTGNSETSRSEAEEGSCASFVAGTSVLTPAGPRAIETIEKGDEVLAYHRAKKSAEAYRVEGTFKRKTEYLVEIRTADEKNATLQTTPEHPFFVANRGWIPANELLPGDVLETAAGVSLEVRSVNRVRGPPRFVYNFAVPGPENYFVGDQAALVHNPSCSFTSKKIKKGLIVTGNLNARGNTGTGTNVAVRRYANDANTPIPWKYKTTIKYRSDDGTRKIKTTGWIVNNRPLRGKKWDAGHIFGRQNGGTGRNIRNIFAQNPQMNRGQGGFRQWREFEDKIKRKIVKYPLDTITQTTEFRYR